MVALCSVCRLEWYVCDLACLLLGLPTVSLFLYVNNVCTLYILCTLCSGYLVVMVTFLPVASGWYYCHV